MKEKPLNLLSVDPARHWEALAQRDPYFSVLTAEESRSVSRDPGSRDRFFQSGEDYVQRLLRAFGDPEKRFNSSLDFGCGVGRITRALAQRSDRVTGVDVSPTMLSLTKENAGDLANLTVMPLFSFQQDRDTFDLVNSFLVFQHIPPAEGLDLLRTLLSRVRRGGLVALHVPYWRKTSKLGRIARWLRSRVPGIHALANLLERKPASWPYMQLNVYDLNAVTALFHDEGFQELRLLEERERDVRGVIILGRKP